MKKNNLTIILCLFLGFGFLKAQEPFVCQGQYYLSLSTATTSPSGLFIVEIDPVSGNTVFNAIAASIGATMNAIGYRSTDNFIYGVNPSPQYLRLYRVGADGVAVDLGVPQDIILGEYFYYAGDVSPDGDFLILLGQSGSDPEGILAFVDLNDPNYAVTTLALTNAYAGIYDIAFDPYSGDLYGFSTISQRLVKININTGVVVSSFPVQSQVGQLGALFFDISGDLFGYGKVSGQSTLVQINKETGIMNSVANGPPSGGEDGCSCPYSIELKKTVSTDVALPCTEIIYTFTITNVSGGTQTGLRLSDVMPVGFTVLEVLSNPFGGTETLMDNIIEITGMTVPQGTDEIQVVVEVGEDMLGLYQNQALLSGLPVSLGETTFSDNPFTFVALDSTPVFIEPLDITYLAEEEMICPGESVYVDASLYGVTYLWEDGSNMPSRVLDEEGNYSVTVSSGCEDVIANIVVTMELNYTYLNEQYFLCESMPPEVDVSEYGDIFLWENNDETPIRILSEEGSYSVTVSDACDLTVINYTVISNAFFLDIIPDVVEIELGEFANLVATYWADATSISFEWIDELGNTLSCTDCLSTVAMPLNDVLYTLIMTVNDGCTYADQVLVKVKKDRAVYIPNVISPNADGINDYFYVQSKRNNVIIKKMSIFDRWGNLVHEAENFDVNQEELGWNATYNGSPVQSSVFVYMIELEFLDGFKAFETGDLTVIR